MNKKKIMLGFFALFLFGCGQKGPLYLPHPDHPKDSHYANSVY